MPKNNPQAYDAESRNKKSETFSMAGKSPKEMELFLLSGEPDDLSVEFFDNI